MPRTASRSLLLAAMAAFATACASDVPSTATGLDASAALAQQGDGLEANARFDRPTTYAIIGDVPYEPLTPSALSIFPSLIKSINQDPDVRRAIHVGDTKSGSTVCSDQWNRRIADHFSTFDDPLVYAIGDNEWTDCHRSNNGGYLPTERLDAVRTYFFPRPGRTLGGKARKVNAQPSYPENQEWAESDVVFGAFHVLGSNNGLDPWFTDPGQSGETPEMTLAREAEYAGRNAANIQWLEFTFSEAARKNAVGVVLFVHADLYHPTDRAGGAVFTGHQLFVERLSQLASAYGRPVLIISGDSHNYRVDAGVPWFSLYGVSPVPTVTQIIVDRSIEASTDADPVNWLKLSIDPSQAYPFSWTQVVVP